MFFSIIVPVYNVEKYLKECLESIRNQTYKDFEVIIVDDGSTDNSPQICDEYQSEDNRFKVIHKSNGGLVSARKTGAKEVSGKYIINIDSDDYIEENLLEELFKAVGLSQPDFIAYGYKNVDQDGKLVSERINDIPIGLYKEEDLERLKSTYLYDKKRRGLNGGSLIFSIWTKAVRREIYIECQQRVDNRIEKGEDLLVVFHILQSIQSALVTDTTGYCYRQQQGSMTHIVNYADIEKQAILNNALLEATDLIREYRNQALICIFYTSYERIQRIASHQSGYYEFRKMIELVNKYGLFRYVREMSCLKPTIPERFKIFIIKYRLWIMLYLYFKRYKELTSHKS